MRPLVLLATCQDVPELEADDRQLLHLLPQRGVDARPAVWTDTNEDWDRAELVVIRSTWDYHHDRDAFLTWAEQLPRVLNDPRVVRWNTDKTYLRDLAAAGLPTVETRWVAPGEPYEPPHHEHVVKPAVSVGSKDSGRYGADERGRSYRHVEMLHDKAKTAMVQPYISTIEEVGETGLVFVGGTYSHAFRKGPLLRRGAPAVHGLYAEEEVEPRVPADGERALAEAILDAVPAERHELLYARVDLVKGPDGQPTLLELELTEPSLFLGMDHGAARRFAAAIAQRLRAEYWAPGTQRR